MGSVYLAERSDEMFHRQAAVKLILPPAGLSGISPGFSRSAKFSRPWTIRISPSCSMPALLKRVGRISSWSLWTGAHPPLVRRTQAQYQRACRIVWPRHRRVSAGYAHRNLVVPQDLKHSNIFVTRNDGVVKLLDFGIAKVLSGTAAGKALDTQTLASMMTPEYASPEQVNGAPVTTQSDLYSLGVVLYELLTGHRPYRLLSAADARRLARVIAEVEPARPSDVVTTDRTRFQTRSRIQITPETISAARQRRPEPPPKAPGGRSGFHPADGPAQRTGTPVWIRWTRLPRIFSGIWTSSLCWHGRRVHGSGSCGSGTEISADSFAARGGGGGAGRLIALIPPCPGRIRGSMASAARHSGRRTGSTDRALPPASPGLQLRSVPLRHGVLPFILRFPPARNAPLRTRSRQGAADWRVWVGGLVWGLGGGGDGGGSKRDTGLVA